MKTKSLVSPVDVYIGARIRMKRIESDMSQTELAKAFGVTFQQVQKYESGANRVGPTRLQTASQVLGVPVAWFFEGAPGASATVVSIANDAMTQFMANARGIALARAFVRLSDDEQRAVVNLVNAFVPQAVAAERKRAGS